MKASDVAEELGEFLGVTMGKFAKKYKALNRLYAIESLSTPLNEIVRLKFVTGQVMDLKIAKERRKRAG